MNENIRSFPSLSLFQPDSGDEGECLADDIPDALVQHVPHTEVQVLNAVVLKVIGVLGGNTVDYEVYVVILQEV